MGRMIGIDLGTTNSVVAIYEADRADTISNPEGSKLTPSVVFYSPDGKIVGDLAKRQLLINPGLGVRSVKRVIGHRFSEVSDRLEDFPFEVVRGPEDRAEIKLSDGQVLPPEQVSADVLARIKEAAEDFLGESVTEAVITVPAYFNDSQRTATKYAAEMAGLEVRRLLNEPTAAALAYGAGREYNETIAVFDFGGGTFDISILQLQNDIFEVLATSGDTMLGGDDLDQRLFQEICDEVLQQTGIDPTQDVQAAARIREAAENAKKELSSATATEISLPFIVADKSGPKHYARTLKRADYVAMVQPILDRLIPPCAQVVADAGLTVDRINNVLLVGGSTRMPRVREMVKQFFKREPSHSVNPDEAVALGAAIQGSVLSGALQEVLLIDVTPLSLGLEVAGGLFKPIIPRNSTIPCEETRKFTTVIDNQTSVVVHVLQGERKIAAENRALAKFKLTGIPAMPRELAEIIVRFHIDANGILEVAAQDLTSGVATGVVIEGYGDLAADTRESQRALESAQKDIEKDEEFMRFLERRTRAERIQAEARRIVDLAASIVAEEDLKSIKAAMFRHDLAIRAKEEMGMAAEEEKLSDFTAKYAHLAQNYIAAGGEEEGSGRRRQGVSAEALRNSGEVPLPKGVAPPAETDPPIVQSTEASEPFDADELEAILVDEPADPDPHPAGAEDTQHRPSLHSQDTQAPTEMLRSAPRVRGGWTPTGAPPKTSAPKPVWSPFGNVAKRPPAAAAGKPASPFTPPPPVPQFSEPAAAPSQVPSLYDYDDAMQGAAPAAAGSPPVESPRTAPPPPEPTYAAAPLDEEPLPGPDDEAEIMRRAKAAAQKAFVAPPLPKQARRAKGEEPPAE